MAIINPLAGQGFQRGMLANLLPVLSGQASAGMAGAGQAIAGGAQAYADRRLQAAVAAARLQAAARAERAKQMERAGEQFADVAKMAAAQSGKISDSDEDLMRTVQERIQGYDEQIDLLNVEPWRDRDGTVRQQITERRDTLIRAPSDFLEGAEARRHWERYQRGTWPDVMKTGEPAPTEPPPAAEEKASWWDRFLHGDGSSPGFSGMPTPAAAEIAANPQLAPDYADPTQRLLYAALAQARPKSLSRPPGEPQHKYGPTVAEQPLDSVSVADMAMRKLLGGPARTYGPIVSPRAAAQPAAPDTGMVELSALADLLGNQGVPDAWRQAANATDQPLDMADLAEVLSSYGEPVTSKASLAESLRQRRNRAKQIQAHQEYLEMIGANAPIDPRPLERLPLRSPAPPTDRLARLPRRTPEQLRRDLFDYRSFLLGLPPGPRIPDDWPYGSRWR